MMEKVRYNLNVTSFKLHFCLLKGNKKLQQDIPGDDSSNQESENNDKEERPSTRDSGITSGMCFFFLQSIV